MTSYAKEVKKLKQSVDLAKAYPNHNKAYYDKNFKLEDGIWRRRPININELEELDNIDHAKARRIELIKVLKHFTKERDFKMDKFIGVDSQEPSHIYSEDTYCCCGENSSLYICTHIETGKRFYLGSSCIKQFDPNFDKRRGGNLKNGICVICNVPLRCNSNNDAGIIRNYSRKKEDKICFECEN